MLLEIAPFSPDFPNFQQLNEQAADMTRLLHNEIAVFNSIGVEIEDADQSIVIRVAGDIAAVVERVQEVTDRINQSFFNLKFDYIVLSRDENGATSNEIMVYFSVKKSNL